MSFPALNLLGFTAKEDSKHFRENQKDPTIRKEFDGGFVSTRSRYTRPPPRIITTGFTDISDANKVLLMNFYTAQRGGAVSFTYIHPVSGESLTVRFAEPFEASYAGMGFNRRWDIAPIKLETV